MSETPRDDELLRSNQAVSGFRYVIYDGRKGAHKAPWSVSMSGYRSAGFSTARDAAVHVWKRQQLRYVSRVKSAPRATTKKRKTVRTYKPRKPRKPPKSQSNAARTTTGQSAPSKSSQALPSAWMTKKALTWRSAVDLFGHRISFHRKGYSHASMAVIKSFQPCSRAPFGVVFDEDLTRVYNEDLLRPRRSDWHVVEWESDMWATCAFRPVCPNCGHPLGVGADAWTVCSPCGHMEPGAASTEVMARLRSSDPFRRAPVSYVECDSDDD